MVAKRKTNRIQLRPAGSLSLFLRASDGSGVDVPLVKYEKLLAKHFTVASWSRADVLIFNAYD
jgi:hypothetical protein